MRVSRGVWPILIVVFIASPARAEDPIDVTSWELTTQATYQGTNSITETALALPLSLTRIVTCEDSVNETSYDFEVTEHSARFGLDFDHEISDHYLSDCISFGEIYFQPTRYLAYSFDGVLALSGTRRFGLSVHLVDQDTLATLYQSAQESRWTPDQELKLGQEEGDTVNLLIGSPTGLLAPGHTYCLSYRALIQTQSYASHVGPAATEGYISFAIIPEPATFSLLSIGAAAAVRRKRRRFSGRMRGGASGMSGRCVAANRAGVGGLRHL